MIAVAGLRKSYGSFVAVRDVSFDIPAGESFGLLGPNGAGKSTTIHMMAGVLRPDGGSIAIEGKPDPMRAEVRRRFGIAPQSLSVYEDLTGSENLRFFGGLYGLRGGELRQRVDDALNLSGLVDRAGDPVKHYSGGMKRRLNLACALLHQPAVLFLDEPTVGVDPQSRNHLFDCIEALAKAGQTIVYTTHYMEEAERLCSRVAIMDQGRILALDSVDSLIRRHGGKSSVVAELVSGRLGEAAEKLERILGAGQFALEGEKLQFHTPEPLEAVAKMVDSGLKLASLHVDRPNLESVFLGLTGRRLRD